MGEELLSLVIWNQWQKRKKWHKYSALYVESLQAGFATP